MSEIIKERNGNKYVYDVTWNKEKKKQEWEYKGKIVENTKVEIDTRKFKSELFKKLDFDRITKRSVITINYKQSKRMWKGINELIDKSFKT